MQIDGNRVYVDGGVMQNVDIGSVVRRCKELGYQENQIVVDVVLCEGTRIEKDKRKKYSVIQSLLRLINIKIFKGGNDDLLHALWNYRDIKIRHIL